MVFFGRSPKNTIFFCKWKGGRRPLAVAFGAVLLVVWFSRICRTFLLIIIVPFYLIEKHYDYFIIDVIDNAVMSGDVS